RPAHRRKGAEPGRLGRALSGTWANRILWRAQQCRHRQLLRSMSATHLESRTLFVVVYIADAQVSRDRGDRPKATTGGARLFGELTRCVHFDGRELCRTTVRGQGLTTKGMECRCRRQHSCYRPRTPEQRPGPTRPYTKANR